MTKRDEFHLRVNAWGIDTVHSRLSIVTFLTPFYRTAALKVLAFPIANMQQLVLCIFTQRGGASMKLDLYKRSPTAFQN